MLEMICLFVLTILYIAALIFIGSYEIDKAIIYYKKGEYFMCGLSTMLTLMIVACLIDFVLKLLNGIF